MKDKGYAPTQLNAEVYKLESWRKSVAGSGVKSYTSKKGISLDDRTRWAMEQMIFDTLVRFDISPNDPEISKS